jgi:hypothetical protein
MEASTAKARTAWRAVGEVLRVRVFIMAGVSGSFISGCRAWGAVDETKRDRGRHAAALEHELLAGLARHVGDEPAREPGTVRADIEVEEQRQRILAAVHGFHIGFAVAEPLQGRDRQRAHARCGGERQRHHPDRTRRARDVRGHGGIRGLDLRGRLHLRPVHDALRERAREVGGERRQHRHDGGVGTAERRPAARLAEPDLPRLADGEVVDRARLGHDQADRVLGDAMSLELDARLSRHVALLVFQLPARRRQVGASAQQRPEHLS